MRKQRVLIVEDDEEMRRFYRDFFKALEPEGYAATIVPDGERALGILASEPVDIVVLDWSLPGISGASLAKALRADARTRAVGILMVTGKSSPMETAIALASGADDHLAKPFDVNVLLARLRSLSRRLDLTFDHTVTDRFPGLELDLSSERVRVDGRLVDLTRKELDILKIFLRRPNISHARDYLWEAVWGYESEQWSHVLTVTVASLRRKLGAWGERIKTHRNEGFSLDS